MFTCSLLNTNMDNPTVHTITYRLREACPKSGCDPETNNNIVIYYTSIGKKLSCKNWATDSAATVCCDWSHESRSGSCNSCLVINGQVRFYSIKASPCTPV